MPLTHDVVRGSLDHLEGMTIGAVFVFGAICASASFVETAGFS